MSASISESYTSRVFTLGRNAGRELVYDVVGTEDETEVQSLLEATAPATYLGLILESVAADPQGGGIWKGTARYVRLDNNDEYTFDTTGGTQKITQSLGTVASYAPAGLTAPDFQGAIGVSDDRVEGVEVTVPVFSWTETHRLDDADVDGAYKLTLCNLTGCYNDATFKGLAAGECKFLGATGSKRGDELWQITYRFAASPNQTGLTVGDITGIDKLGWDYMWIRYAEYTDTGAKAVVKRPVAVYVERVSNPADFSTLGIGTT